MKFLLLSLLPILLYSQKEYVFDTALEYETHNLDKGTVSLNTTFINSQDNSYYLLISRTKNNELQLMLEDRGATKYVYIDINVGRLKKGDVIKVNSKSFNRMVLGSKKSVWQINDKKDTLINGKSFTTFRLAMSAKQKRKLRLDYDYRYWVDNSQTEYVPNFTGEYGGEFWKDREALPRGIITKWCAIKDDQSLWVCTSLKVSEKFYFKVVAE